MELITEEQAIKQLKIPQDAFDMFVGINKLQVITPPAPITKILKDSKSERFFLREEIDKLEIEIAPFMGAIRNQRRILERDLTGESDLGIELLKKAKEMCLLSGINPSETRRLPNARTVKWDYFKWDRALNALDAEIEIRARPRTHTGTFLYESIDTTLARLTKSESPNGKKKKGK